MSQEIKHTFTPGPWVISKLGAVFAPNGKNAGNREGIELAEIYGSFNAPGTQDYANARLIAAAPELLEALEAYCLAFELGKNHDTYGSTKAIIAKARGQA